MTFWQWAHEHTVGLTIIVIVLLLVIDNVLIKVFSCS